MDIVVDLVVALSKWSRMHLRDIALAIMATALVLFGPLINAWVGRSIGHLNFFIRTFMFMLVCALGYGLAIIYLTPVIATSLAHLSNFILAPVLMMIFVLVGILAGRH